MGTHGYLFWEHTKYYSLWIKRIPFAKQEYAKENGKFTENEASVHDIEVGSEGGDLKFKINGKIYSIRDFISRFNRLMGRVKPDDVLRDLRNVSNKKLEICPKN